MAAKHFIVWIYRNLFNQFPINKHLDILFNTWYYKKKDYSR